MAYDLYPAVDPTYNFPPVVRAALAASTELRNTVVPMTTTLRNNLTGAELWDGRLILNTTTNRINRYDLGTTQWLEVANLADVVAGDTVNQNLRTKNRIINGNFEVNQRAFTSVSTSSYGFDRFFLSTVGGTVTYSAQVSALGDLPESAGKYARIVSSGQSAISDYAVLAQAIESVGTLSGKTATISFWARAGSGTPKVAVEFEQFFGTTGSPSASVYSYIGQVTLSTTWTRYSLTIAVPSIAGKTLGSNHSIALRLYTSAGSNFNARTGSLGIQNTTIDFWGVQVEEGSTATPFEIEQYGDNLRRCQRYYCELAPLGVGHCVTTTTAVFIYPLPVPMRIIPTVSYRGAVSGIQIFSAAGGAISTTNIQDALYSSANAFRVLYTVASGLVVGNVTTGVYNGTYLTFTAEL